MIKILTRKQIKECPRCSGEGFVIKTWTTKNDYGRDRIWKHEKAVDCPVCEGKGQIIDKHYIIIVNDIAFGMDTIK